MQLRMEGVKWVTPSLAMRTLLYFTCATAAAPFNTTLSFVPPLVYGIHLSRCVNLVAVFIANPSSFIFICFFFTLEI